MVVVVEETLMVEVERCSDKGGGLVVYTRVTASMANGAVCDSCHRFPRWMRQTALLDEEVHGIPANHFHLVFGLAALSKFTSQNLRLAALFFGWWQFFILC